MVKSQLKSLSEDIAREAERRKVEIENNRNIPEDIADRLKACGLVKMWASRKYGGSQLNVSAVCEIIKKMAGHNASVAWVTAVTGCSSLFSGFLPEDTATLLFQNDDSMVGGFAGPAGTAEYVDGGLRVTGKWSWGSGITHCSHIVGGVRLIQDGEPKGTGVVFFEPVEIQMHDNWHVLGLKGTNSIDYSCEEVFIPDVRWSRFPIIQPAIDQPLYRFSFLGALSLSVASVGLGLATRALDEIVLLSQVKKPFGQGKPLAKRPEAQEKIGSIWGKLLSAVALFDSVVQEAETEIMTGNCSLQTKAKIRLGASRSVELSSQVVNEAYRLAGGSSVWESSKLEEILRDMSVVTQHGMVNSGNLRTSGAVLLGNAVPEAML